MTHHWRPSGLRALQCVILQYTQIPFVSLFFMAPEKYIINQDLPSERLHFLNS